MTKHRREEGIRTMTLVTHHGTKTIQDFVDLFSAKRLNLSPAFQRQSVWSVRDRRLLINSIFDNMPIPSVYLYRQTGKGGLPLQDVIDGKQRLESILLFMRKGPLRRTEDELWVKRSFNEGDPLDWWAWSDLDDEQKNQFLTTKLPTIEVEGDLGRGHRPLRQDQCHREAVDVAGTAPRALLHQPGTQGWTEAR